MSRLVTTLLAGVHLHHWGTTPSFCPLPNMQKVQPGVCSVGRLELWLGTSLPQSSPVSLFGWRIARRCLIWRGTKNAIFNQTLKADHRWRSEMIGESKQRCRLQGLSPSECNHLDGVSSSRCGRTLSHTVWPIRSRDSALSTAACEHLRARSPLPFSAFERVIDASSSSLWLRRPQVRVCSCVWR